MAYKVSEEYSSTHFDILFQALVTSADLGYDKTFIRFDNDTVETAFKLLFPDKYKELLENLKKKSGGNE